ncbi:PEP/pyruvate-binding domain-containing protein [Desulfococcaceae bacterium HSG7]|nr:PEP/pyruvate-binding domain-containing protein [Desulfococcaceae bacterium HSG7]
MNSEKINQRIDYFQRRFGEAHLYFAYHAAFPLSLTPDLSYRLWVNFQRDSAGNVLRDDRGRALRIPWIAVADMLLSNLCSEVAHELYEMEQGIRNELLKRLRKDDRFGNYRIKQLVKFLEKYIEDQLHSDDSYVRSFAKSQQWMAMAFIEPGKVACELAEALSEKVKANDKTGIVRVASLVNTIAEPLIDVGFDHLLIYSNLWDKSVRGDTKEASFHAKELLQNNRSWINFFPFYMENAQLQNISLRGANLAGISLKGADLTDANLAGADLKGADLTDANLAGAILKGADLSKANLTDANLSGANLKDVVLADANLTRAILPEAGSEKLPISKDEKIEGEKVFNYEIRDSLDATRINFKLFHELMAKKVTAILLVSSLYDANIMEEDGRLSERITNEYRGLNLTQPPRIYWVSSAEEALEELDAKAFDLVITMPRLADMDAFALGRKIKRKIPDIPVILMSHRALMLRTEPPAQANLAPYGSDEELALKLPVQGIDQVFTWPGGSDDEPALKLPVQGIDRVFTWSGDADILFALIKMVEDRLNVVNDTEIAGVRVILFVEDSPVYASILLPILYRSIVSQVQKIMNEGLNEEHRLLTMRARPKILYATNFEEAKKLFDRFEPYILGVISDVRFPHHSGLDANAGITLLSKIKKERFDIPLLLTSSEPSDREKADLIPTAFIDKNSPSLISEVLSFFIEKLGFGDFVFFMPDGQEIDRASNFREFENVVSNVPDESINYHWRRNDFSRWLFARSEIRLATNWRPLTADDFGRQVEIMKRYLIETLSIRRQLSQKGIVVSFDADDFALETDFFKIGNGSLGGKARGLAFVRTMLQRYSDIHLNYDNVRIFVPQTLVITTQGFDTFIEENNLKYLAKADISDAEVAAICIDADFPQWITDRLRVYLTQIKYPLAVRSSGLLEDAQFRAYAGLYSTYMLPNDHPDLEQRLEQLIMAVKLVYASTFFNDPKAFARRVGHRNDDEKMAIIIQLTVGERQGDYFYPAIAGVAQSVNYYPFGKMKPEEGIVAIALGLGKILAEGDKTLRFSPRYPQFLPRMTRVDDVLKNSQQYFYALKMESSPADLKSDENATLAKRSITDAEDEPALKLLSSTYIPEEHRIRDTVSRPGHRVITFAQVLKYDLMPLPKLLSEILEMAQKSMACPVEMEFAVSFPLPGDNPEDERSEFAILQVRPLTVLEELMTVDISPVEIDKAICYSDQALGNTDREDISDILYVKPDAFDPAYTRNMAEEIGSLNAEFAQIGHKYILVGPGRWGSADRWLGIPVKWADISGIGAIIETYSDKLKVESSQGSHFFHNITTLGINYITVPPHGESYLDWEWITKCPKVRETAYIVHARVSHPFKIKVDGRKSEGVILP